MINKKAHFLTAMLAGALAFGILFVACENPSSNDPEPEVNSELYELMMNIGYSPKFTQGTHVQLDWDPVPQEVADNDQPYSAAATVPNATGHLQGMIRDNDGNFWASTVYVTTSTSGSNFQTDYPEEWALGMDRTPGKGVGYVVCFGPDGKEIKRVKVGEGNAYHPGGIDFDGTYIWVPAAEYRPNSSSILYRVDPTAPVETAAVEVLRVPDHVGGLLHDQKNHTLIGNTWGSRRFYTWPLNSAGLVDKTSYTREELAQLKVLNRNAYVDYQDNMYVGNGKMIASGISGDVGGIDVIDCATGNIESTNRIVTFVSNGTVLGGSGPGAKLCQNPFWLEVNPNDESKINAYFAPEDDVTWLYVFEAEPSNHRNASIVGK
ncbi:hypothetical protein AGMMS50293_19170 [Spirochaetia bacterium]|nr:hypothetical protein AGMMS50293_19170 [Spirochaetia bacterium]